MTDRESYHHHHLGRTAATLEPLKFELTGNFKAMKYIWPYSLSRLQDHYQDKVFEFRFFSCFFFLEFPKRLGIPEKVPASLTLTRRATPNPQVSDQHGVHEVIGGVRALIVRRSCCRRRSLRHYGSQNDRNSNATD